MLNSIYYATQYFLFSLKSKGFSLPIPNRSTRGQGMVEYALILVLVAVLVIAAASIMGPLINGVFMKVSCTIDPSKIYTNTATGITGDCKAHGLAP